MSRIACAWISLKEKRAMSCVRASSVSSAARMSATIASMLSSAMR